MRGPVPGDTAVVGFESAGQIHGFHALDRDRLTLIVDRPRRHAPDGVVWHRLEDLRPDHVTLIDGLAVTTVARTVVDLAAVLRNGRFEQLVEDEIVRGLFTIGEVGGMLAQLRRRGKPGVLRTEAARCGYLTTRMMWEHLKSDPGGCATALADIYRQRLALFDPR